MNPENIPNEIFDLLSRKSYAQLSTEQVIKVNKHMSAHEYTSLHESVTSFQLEDRKISPVGKGVKHKNENSWLRHLLTYPIPFYQVAASLLLIMGVWFVSSKQRSDAQPAPTYTKSKSIDQDAYPDKLVFNL